MGVHIDGFAFTFQAGQTILEVAQAHGINIPTMCHVDGLAPSGACGLCVVEGENGKLLRACATVAVDGMVVLSRSPKVISARKSILELNLSTHRGDCKAPCQLACPAESHCQGYIALIAAGQLGEAVKIMKDAHPFPASIARCCSRPCEEACRRGLVDEAVNIAGLKGFAADYALEDEYVPEIAEDTGKSVAIVGGGPGGLTAAYFLRRLGHKVSVFEAMPKMGGLFRYGIPEYRLPKAVLDAELKIFSRMGVEFFNHVKPNVSQLKNDYDTVIVAIGAGVSKPLGCIGDNFAIGGLDFLRAVACNKPPIIGRRVVVVGGNNTAMDAARTALRLGAEVFVSYRRTKNEMPAQQTEIEDAIAEGVQFLFLTAPIEVSTDGIRLQKMKLGTPDTSGRRQPVPIDGENEWIPADTVISAIGQDVSLEGTGLDSLDGIIAIGDVTGTTAYAIEAIGQGRKVAGVIHKHLNGEEDDLHWEVMPKFLVRDAKTTEDFSDIPKKPRQGNHVHELTPVQAAHEAERCLSCGCSDYYECKLIDYANEYNASPDKYSCNTHHKPLGAIDTSNFYFHRDMNKCIHCSVCVRVCAHHGNALTMAGRGFDTTVEAAFGQPLQNRDECTMCGNCVAYCPTGALYEVPNMKKAFITPPNLTGTTCILCDEFCPMVIETKAGHILRCRPIIGYNYLCEKGRFGFRYLGEKLIVPLVRKEGILRRASIDEAAKAIQSGFNVLMAQYGGQSIGVGVSARYTVEDVAAVKAYAEYLGTPHVLTTDTDEYMEVLRSGAVKGLIHFGDDLPPEVVEIPLAFLVLQTAYVTNTSKKSAARANVILPAPSFGEVDGHVKHPKSGELLPVNGAFPPACGYQTRDLIKGVM
ncbi:MAG: FAD-dependent oxidoreductase [Defluviitaleaceae bacterium]|nr:FAD-dependent oxidoreductase [Defluviitaleaceae bacterium]